MKNIKPQIKKYTLGLFLFVLLHFVSFSWAQFDIPPKPKNQTSVYDYAKILSNSESKKVEEKLIKYSDSTSTQIIFISIETLKGENIGLLAPR